MAATLTLKQIEDAVARRGFEAKLAGWNERYYGYAGGFANYARGTIRTVGDARRSLMDEHVDSLLDGHDASDPVVITD